MREIFKEIFNRDAAAEASAPGRVNLIGDHTDYAGGFCLPMPLALETRVAMAPAPAFRAHSLDLDETAPFDPAAPARGDWTDYIAGPLAVLRQAGFAVPPVEVLVSSDVPQGAGVSSSAALEVATLRAALDLSGAKLPDMEVARLAQSAENVYCGVQCGILDQMASAVGRPGQALLLDCRSNGTRLVPVPPEFHFAIVHCGEARRLVDGEYNERRRSVEEAARLLGMVSLRDAGPDDLAGISDVRLLKRARHVVSENTRVTAAVAALERRDLRGFGMLMVESHRSLAENFEVSTPVLDRLVDDALEAGAYGARLTGAGFGGCIVALLPAGREVWWKKVSAAHPKAWLVQA
ncbi:galactokinase [Parvibaculum lavamentivorans DS-1]|uniref:Galactokinase n=1 Tax=Parvibaculum lavamentivorans (strain DS-1 / DSM 13023 / NCIMB 13966) TaxID=402881 RepID=A7HUG6_PARL1|nr:galactokinase [Parvibaculum lavamentivorans]ABS63549.1 galactokinase [Parvibaculum lavamentivorans DS-1]